MPRPPRDKCTNCRRFLANADDWVRLIRLLIRGKPAWALPEWEFQLCWSSPTYACVYHFGMPASHNVETSIARAPVEALAALEGLV